MQQKKSAFIKTTHLFLLLLFVNLSNAQVRFISPDSLLKIIQQPQDSGLTVINFWATWCKPCVKELPYFNKVDSAFGKGQIKFIFVSFDGPSEIKKVGKFVKLKKYIGRQLILNSADLSDFIESINHQWQGDLPYTIVIKNGQRKDHSTSFENYIEIISFVKT